MQWLARWMFRNCKYSPAQASKGNLVFISYLSGYIFLRQRSSWLFDKQAWGRLSTAVTCYWARFTFDIAQSSSGDGCIHQFADFILASCVVEYHYMLLTFCDLPGLWAVVQETLSLVRTVRVYGTETKEHRRYKQWLDKLAFISMRESAAYGFWNLSFSTLYRSTQILAIILGGMSILTGHASAEQLTKYVLYCEWLIYASWRVADNLSSLLQSVGASEKVFQLMDLLPSDQFSSTGVQLERLTGNIEFVNVSFYYPSRMSVGLSGSGKSSLVNLLLRLYEPIRGQILLDGLPLRDLDIRWLRNHIGYVGQEPHLFRLDVKSNISYGCSGDIMLEDVERAAKQAYAHEFISSFPSGYETIIDDELLSGGQKQRIAIARAIFRDPAILILDEATSALDVESEYYIQGLLQSFKNDSTAKRTVIFIAHRISTAKAADRIIVMESGRVVEMGNHKELLLQNGLYAKLYRTQTEALV